MARVPVPIENGRRLSPVAGSRFQAPDIGAGARAIGASIERLGQATAQAADTEKQIVDIYAEARKNQGTNDYQEFERGLFFGDDGFYNKKNADALNARDTTQQAIDKKIGALLEQTQDGRERQMLQVELNRHRQEAFNGIARYSQGQAKQYAITQSDARIGNASDRYSLFVDTDPERARSERATVLSEVRARADLEGWNDSEIFQSAKLDALSAMHEAYVSAKMINDPVAAAVYLEKNSDEFTPRARMKLDNALDPVLDQRDADGIADFVFGTMTPGSGVTASPSAAGAGSSKGSLLSQMFPITVQTESGGNPNAVSPKGAKGLMQVMPGTSRDPGFGIRPSNGTKADDVRVGRDYLNAMMVRYGNNPAMAWAAYNAGPGTLDSAVARHGDGWLGHMPRETRNYVTKNMKALGSEKVPVNAFLPIDTPLSTLREATERELDARGIVDPNKRRLAHGEVERRHRMDKAEKSEAESAMWDGALEQVFALGDGFTSITQINGYQSLPPDRRISLQRTAEQNVRRMEVETEPQTDWGFYAGIMELADTDPKGLRAVPIEQARARLGDAEFKEFAKARTSKPGDAKSPKRLTFKEILGASQTILHEAGYVTGNSKEARGDAKDVNRFLGRMQQWAEGIHAQTGKWPDTETIRKQARRSVLDVEYTVPGRVWDSTETGKAFEREEGTFRVIVPDDARKTIIRALGNPTEAEIRRAYIDGQGEDW